MATTTNFGWETPDDTDLVKDGALAMRTLGNGIDTSFVDLKGGTTGQVLSKATNTDLDFSWTTLTEAAINPNLIINGNFCLNQRGYVSAANLASGSYGFDRWKSNYTNTTLTFTSAPNGQSVTINQNGVIRQIVERASVPSGSYVLSWSGTATGRVYNSGATAPSYAASPVTFSADGSANVIVEFTATGSTKTLSNVKLEAGTTVTPFVLAGGSIGGELTLAQRYYYKTNSQTENPGSTVSDGSMNGVNYSNLVIGLGRFPTTMRGIPTITLYSPATGASGKVRSGGADVSATAENIGDSAIGYISASVTNGANSTVHYVADAEL